MKLLPFALIPLLLAPFTVLAHEYWIAPSQTHATDGSDVTLEICEGHDFPLCEDFEFPDTFTGLFVIGPDGKRKELEVTANDAGTAVATWRAADAGRHGFTVQMVMSHARRGEIPLYTTRSEVRVGDNAAQQPPAGIDQGLEIFVVDDLAAGGGEDRIRFRALNNGRPAQASLQIQPADGRRFSINADMNGEASMRRPAPGHYLVFTSHQGVSGSVSFTIPE